MQIVCLSIGAFSLMFGLAAVLEGSRANRIDMAAHFVLIGFPLFFLMLGLIRVRREESVPIGKSDPVARRRRSSSMESR